MEIAKERPVKSRKRVTPIEPISDVPIAQEFPVTSSVDSKEIQRLVKRLENLEVVSNGTTNEVFPEGPSSRSEEVISFLSDSRVRFNGEIEHTQLAEDVTPTEKEEESPGAENDENELVKSLVENERESAETESVEIQDAAVLCQTTLEPAALANEASKCSAAELVESSSIIQQLESQEMPPEPVLPVLALPMEAATTCRSQLYPEIDQIGKEELEKEETLYRQLQSTRVQVSAPPMVFALEPLTEMQLRSFYYNAELEQVDDFVEEFLAATLLPVSNDEFFSLLQSYLDACRRIEQLQLDAQDLTQRWDSAKRNVWLMENVVFREQGTCGDGHQASGSYTVQRAKFQQNCYEDLKILAQRCRQLRVVQLPFASHQAKTAELQCKHHVCLLLQRFRTLTGVTSHSPIFVRFDGVPEQIAIVKSSIRNCITILFHFLRQPVAESAFKNSCRLWLNDLSGNLLRFSFVDDHLFLISHVLRCPNGVGLWAAGYVQPACHLDSSLDGERAVDHFLAMLYICLNPIRRREDYLQSFLSPDVANSWTIVDVDGEEDRELEAISEADLLCLLNQFSFDQLFAAWFGHLQQLELTESKILRLFAFELTVLRLLFDGIRAYHGLQYKQICKHLAYVMRQSVQYVAEFWLYFKSLQVDSNLCAKLQLEFDRLVLYTVFYGTSSKGLGVWQFLADLPYGDVSVEFQWRLVDSLLSPACNGVSPRDLFNKPVELIQKEMQDTKMLELRLHDLDQTDATYLLTALSNMARLCNDVTLVQSLATLLFVACFERPATRETHHKAGRDLISAVVERHSWLLSYLLALTETRLEYLGGYALELFDHLPTHSWSLSERDWSILRSWLFRSLASLPNTLAQRILHACNWGFVPGSKTSFMSPLLHREVAEAVVKAYDDLCPVQAGLISGSIKKASKMASSVSGQLSSEQQFMEFCWALLLRLKLHPFDVDMSEDIIVFGAEANLAEDLLQRASGGNPFAAFLVFQLRVRSVESLTQHGFPVLEQLLNNYIAKPATVCVIYALRLLSCVDVAQNEERFRRYFDSLVHMDDTYYQYAKTFIASNAAGENLSNLGSALSEVVLTLASKRQSDASKFVNYAIRLCIYSNTKCFADRSSLYILDRLIEASFINDPSLNEIVEALRIAYEHLVLAQHRGAKGGMLSLFRGEKPPPSLLASSYFRDFPWLAYASVKTEQATFDQYYQTLRIEMMRNSSLILEDYVKNANSRHGVNVTIDQLAPFLYLDLACAMDGEHPLLPLVCQECCLGLFQRIRLTQDPSLPVACLGGFYMRSKSFATKVDMLKKVLQAIVSDQKTAKSEQQPGPRLELFGAVAIWLADTRLWMSPHHASSMGLPLSYALEGVFNGNSVPWLEFVDFESVRLSIEKRARAWSRCRFGSIPDIVYPRREPPQVSPLRRLFERAKDAESQTLTPAPTIGAIDPVFFTPDVNLLQSFGQVFGIVQPLLDNFYAAANDFNDMQRSVVSLDELYFEQLKQLYADFNVQVSVTLRCQRGCANPNNTKVMTKTSKLATNIQRNLDQNRVNWSDTIDNVSALLSCNIPHHCACLYAIVRQLICSYGEAVKEDVKNRLRKTGVDFFYKLVSAVTERILEFPPTKALFHASIEALGMAFVLRNPNEIEKLLNLMKEKQSISTLLLNFYDTDCATNEAFLRMYQKLVDWTLSQAMVPNHLMKSLKRVNVANALGRFNLSEIGQLNKLALLACNASKAESHAPLLSVLREHWTQTFVAGLPRNFRSSLDWLLQECMAKTAPVNLLDDALSALKSVHMSDTSTLGPVVYIEIVAYLSEFFQHQRTKCKECWTFGIYHCWELHAPKMWPLLSFCYQRSVLNPEAYESFSEGIKKSFSSLEALYRPWIEPQFTKNEIRPPWSISVSPVADAFMQSFVDGLCYVQHLYTDQPESVTVACTMALEWYVGKTEPCAGKLGSYILRSYQTQLLRLSWLKFRPSITNMELLAELLKKEGQAPFATSIVVRLPWTELFRSLSAMPLLVRRAMSDLLLTIAVRSASKERNYADCKASLPELIQTLNGIDWSFLEVTAVETACSTVMQSYDAGCILQMDDEGSVNGGILRLLAAACNITSRSSADVESVDSVTQKRIQFIRLFVALLVRCSRYADIPASDITQVFTGLIWRIDTIVQSADPNTQRNTAVKLLSEATLFWNQANKQTFDNSIELLGRYLAENSGSVIALPLIQAFGLVAANVPTWLVVAETCISGYFARASTPTWSEVTDHLIWKESWTRAVKAECQANGYFLVFYGFCSKRLQMSKELSDETLLLRDAIEMLKTMNERQLPEAPAAVLIGFALHLLVRQVQFGASGGSVVGLVRDLASCLQYAAEGKTGILSSLGLTKRISYSPRFQLLATIISNYSNQQIIDDDHVRLSGASAVAKPRTQWATTLRAQKQYAPFLAAIEAGNSFIVDSSMHLGDMIKLFATVAPIIFTERYVIDQCSYYATV